MSIPSKQGKTKAKKRGFFTRGLAVLLPTILTVFLFTSIWNFVQRHVVGPINGTIYGVLEGNGMGWIVLGAMDIDPYAREYLDPDELPSDLVDRMDALGGLGSASFQAALTAWRLKHEAFLRNLKDLAIDPEKLREAVAKEVHPAVGVVLSAVLVLVLGYLASGFLGRSLISGFDRLLHRIPLIRAVYPYAKQLTEFFINDTEYEFETVVAAPYPSEGVWSLGFVTGSGLRSMHEALGGRFVSVFIPTSPMPMTGFTIFMDEATLVPLDISVDEALRICVSAGVLVPQGQQVTDPKDLLPKAA
ncbi:MAG TPA: DUF502 domain-containing protein [Planctomycetota bacterium]|nr:DUF502 domain-containing protein [Planctomycetota bacterium]HPF12959.1 DUF502 domain-containing protein [Planctomycetota bacterium]HRV79852.1 DUF502 domain-containing protein [Planctomycetota bacterium]